MVLTQQQLVWDLTGASPQCVIPPGESISIEFTARVKPGTTVGTYQNTASIKTIENPPTQYTGPGTDSNPFRFCAGAAGLPCNSTPSSYEVVKVFQVDSKKGVKGQLNFDPAWVDGSPGVADFFYSGTGFVAETVQGGNMVWSMELFNSGNVPATNLDIIDILPFNNPPPGNTGVGTGAPMGSTWQPFFLAPIDTSTAPPGTKVYYSTDANPCRPAILTVPGCQVMTTLADGIPQTDPGQWSTVLPGDPTQVRSFRINFGAYELAPAGTLRFEWLMSAPTNAPIGNKNNDANPLATTGDTNIAWNTFGYSVVRMDTGAALASAPTRVGIITSDVPPGLNSFGNYVWEDINRNGIQDEPAAAGLNGVRVELWKADDINGTNPVLYGIQLTMDDGSGNQGYYNFPALPDGFYFAKFYPPTLLPSGSPVNATSDDLDSDGTPVGDIYQSPVVDIDSASADPNPINHVDTDQGFFNQWISIGNTVWLDTNNDGLISSGEPTKDGILVELFFDANSDGILNDSSDVGGVNEFIPISVQLTRNGGHYLFTQKTDQNGVPLGLPLVPALMAGNYFVGVSPYNFNPTGAPATINGQPFPAGQLLGYASSLTSVSNSGVVTDNPLPAQTDTNADNSDDGSRQGVGSPFYVGGVMSGKLLMEPDAEPIGEVTLQEGTTGGQTNGFFNTIDGTPGGLPIDDINSNVTVDFGFFRLALGDVVWLDTGAGAAYNNGVLDPGESPVPGVRVQLFSADGTTEILVGPDGILGTADDAPGGMFTNAMGKYLFQALPQGTYTVKITPPLGYVSSGDIASTPAPSNNTNSDDNGIGTGFGTITSGQVTLTPGNAGLLNNNQVSTTLASTYDPTVDFGLTPPVSIGNTVWLDANNDGIINSGESPKGGVLVDLFFDADGNGSITGTEATTPVARMLTNASGQYLFTQTTNLTGIPTGNPLIPGNYQVGVSPFNFITAGAPTLINGVPFVAGNLAGYQSSGTSMRATGAITESTFGVTNTDGDNLDDGTRQTAAPYAGGVLSGILNVKPGQEPVGEATQPTGTTGGATLGFNNTVNGTPTGFPIPDIGSNVTVDFGFYRLQLGDLVWVDTGAGANYNNGVYDAGEVVLPGVKVQLFASDGTTEIPVGPDGILGTGDDALGGMLTNAGGMYLFSGLPQGDYVVKVTAPTGYYSSTDIVSTPSPNSNVNSDDNGIGNTGGLIAANPVTLTPGAAGVLNNNIVSNPTATTTNPTVDFGLLSPMVSVGNTVWFDTNNDGLIQPTEATAPGVLVELFFDADNSGSIDTLAEQTPIARQLTNAQGYYLFTERTDSAGFPNGVALAPGNYQIGVSQYNFIPGGAPAQINGQPFVAGSLAGYDSSGTSINNAGVVSEAAIVANGTTDSNADNYDDGLKQSTGYYYSTPQKLDRRLSRNHQDRAAGGRQTGRCDPVHHQGDEQRSIDLQRFRISGDRCRPGGYHPAGEHQCARIQL